MARGGPVRGKTEIDVSTISVPDIVRSREGAEGMCKKLEMDKALRQRGSREATADNIDTDPLPFRHRSTDF
jgi:hypothetical protein